MTATAFRVATFNIRNGLAFDGCNSWPLRRRATLHAVRELDADLVALQEAFGFQLRWLASRLPEYAVVGTGRSRRGGEHVPVLARRARVRLVEHATKWFGDTPDVPGSRLPGAGFPRIATCATVEVGGVALQFTSTHLDEKSAAHRDRSAAQLIEWTTSSPLPQVVAGDFNAEPDAALFGAFSDAGLRSAIAPDAPGGTAHNFTGRRDGRRLDHVLVSGAIEVMSAQVVYGEPGARLASDHWPVVADLRVS